MPLHTWKEGGVRHVEIVHSGFDMVRASQIGAAKCRSLLGTGKLVADSVDDFSRATVEELAAMLGVGVRVSGMQRETVKLSEGRFRTFCYAADSNITSFFQRAPKSADINQARLAAGVNEIAAERYSKGIEILQKLRDETNYKNALPAIVAGLIKIDISLATEIDERYVRLEEVDYRPALILYRDATSAVGWERRSLEVVKRLSDQSQNKID